MKNIGTIDRYLKNGRSIQLSDLSTKLTAICSFTFALVLLVLEINNLVERPVDLDGILFLLVVLILLFFSNLLMTSAVDIEIEGRHVWIGQVFSKKEKIDIRQVKVKNELSLRRLSITTITYQTSSKKRFGIILKSSLILKKVQSAGEILKYAQEYFRNVSVESTSSE